MKGFGPTLVMIVVIALVVWLVIATDDMSATQQCERLIANATTHADTVVVYAARPLQHSGMCQDYLK